jgi:hypothetical protein
MTNDEALMTKELPSSNDETVAISRVAALTFVIGNSLVIRHFQKARIQNEEQG